jgi:hypothetical protein
MRTNWNRLVLVALAVGTLAVRGVTVRGGVVIVTVANTGARAQSGIIRSRVLINGRFVEIATPVTVAAGSESSSTLPLPDPGKGTAPLGVVVDDGVPF